MQTPFRQPTINFAPVRVAGLGGVPLLVLVVLMALVVPVVRWLLVFGAASGILVGGAMILVRQRLVHADPGDDLPLGLSRDGSATSRTPREHTTTVVRRPIELRA